MAHFEQDDLTWSEGDMPYSRRFGDYFYSQSDGQAECRHVFLGGNGLPDRWNMSGDFTIGELGFGTGLNFLETWRNWRESRSAGSLSFVSFEAFPMAAEHIERALASWPELYGLAEKLLAHWPSLSGIPTDWAMDERTTLTVTVGDALDGVRNWRGPADAWYLDGFAPARNPEMWSSDLMQAVADRTKRGGTFASYTSAGWVRRNLQAAGFSVEKRPGHAGKREMTSGVKPT
ncbi:MAG: 5-methylaminomethyl-2-thiouridine methyltransferase [Ahrensia sp.]|nr:5-methylaminomethyl-2-thiouridine methyltransferase [Ahrensia sp.]|tara:strand:+ start:74333 stop:75028 length:696 start_codon:yes stop_codon:yes gene_type:complete